MSVEEYIEHVETCLAKTLDCVSKCSPDIVHLDGMSGTLTRHFYNNLLELDNPRYLEIGAYKGSSTCSAMFGNKATVVVIDNWSEFGGPKEECIKNLEKYAGSNKVCIVDKDSFSVDVKNDLSQFGLFNIYMYDGCHKRDSHEKAVTHYYDALDKVFIFVVDDWNWGDVRDGTYDGIKKTGLQIRYEKIIHTDQNCCSDSWWNGIGIFVLEKPI